MTAPVRIGVGTGSPEGINSAYLIPDERTVIDPGPPSQKSWETLTAGIDRSDLSVDAIDHVLVTHWHIDHAGLAPRLAEYTGASLHLHKRDAPLVGDYAHARNRRLERDTEALSAWGVPDDHRVSVIDGDTPSSLPDRYPVRTHAAGDTIGDIEVVHTPGHTLGHTAFATDSDLFVGDAVLPTYTPNVGGSDTRAENPLESYFRTLDRLKVHEGKTPYPGHGTSVSLPDDIEKIRDHHDRRMNAVLDTVDELEPVTPWAVARRLFGDLDGVHIKFGAGEAASHLEYLVRKDVLARTTSNPYRYRIRDEDYVTDVNFAP